MSVLTLRYMEAVLLTVHSSINLIFILLFEVA